MQFYTDPSRADTYTHPHSLPDAETFYINTSEYYTDNEGEGATLDTGWYWQSCFPGCLPDGSPNGPFDTEAEAIADAREGM